MSRDTHATFRERRDDDSHFRDADFGSVMTTLGSAWGAAGAQCAACSVYPVTILRRIVGVPPFTHLGTEPSRGLFRPEMGCL